MVGDFDGLLTGILRCAYTCPVLELALTMLSVLGMLQASASVVIPADSSLTVGA